MIEKLPHIINKSIEFTPDEKNKITLGSIHHTKTNTWIEATKIFNTTCELMSKYGHQLDINKTYLKFIDNNNEVWIAEMKIVISEPLLKQQKSKVLSDDFFKDFNDLFGTSGNTDSPFESFLGKNDSPFKSFFGDKKSKKEKK